jgi:1-acyl-sn-glycerol-3-phosphate acyltransferase
MLVYAPWQIEMLGAADIPPRPLLGALSRFYGYTTINRGNVDRAPLTQLLDLLGRGGIVGIFPEGGVWDTGRKPAKRGVAWLSHRGQVPILPIGFGGVTGALSKLCRLQRPRLWMNVGDVIPPVTLTPGKSRKACLRKAAAHVMEVVDSLIPDEGRVQQPEVRDERFLLKLVMRDAHGNDVPYPGELELVHGSALCKMLYRPVIMRVFTKDLRLPAHALERLNDERNPAAFVGATKVVLDYVENRNPGFFTYRFGYAEGTAMEAGLRELHAVAAYAAKSGYSLSITPMRWYYLPDRGTEVAESSPGQAHLW